MELFGDRVHFSPYEVQIMEHIMEYADQHKNMKWYAEQLGLSQATHSKYVQRLVNKGLLEKYHKAGNRKDIILMVWKSIRATPNMRKKHSFQNFSMF